MGMGRKSVLMTFIRFIFFLIVELVRPLIAVLLIPILLLGLVLISITGFIWQIYLRAKNDPRWKTFWV